jgi:hypothetical protein
MGRTDSMVFVIFDPVTNLYRGHKGRETWSGLKDAEVFRSKGGATQSIKSSQKTWHYYASRWTNPAPAEKSLELWKRVVVIEAVLEVTDAA